MPEISDTGSPKSPPDARVSPNSSESSAVGPAFSPGEVQPCPAGQPSNPLNNVQPKARPTAPVPASSRLVTSEKADDAPPVPQGVPKVHPDFKRPMMIEIFAGSAILSSCFKSAGWDILPIDHKFNRFHPLAKICTLDLTLPSAWSYLQWVCNEFRVLWVHAAPPCGTSSRARERPNAPPPLRGEQNPWGLEHIPSNEQARLDAANLLYMQLYDFTLFLQERKIHWSIENPANSWLWQLDPYAALVEQSSKVCLQSCAFGGSRPTWKAFLTSMPQLLCLGLSCPGNHQHAPYGRKRLPDGQMHYATSEEAVYPRGLCHQLVQVISRTLHVPILDITSKPSCASLVQAAAAHQTRGHTRPTVVSEFSHVVDLELPSLPQVNAKQRLRHAVRHVPAGSKLLMYSLKGVEGNRSFCCKFGCYRSKAQFVADALVASHPFFDSLPLPDSSKKALFTLLVKGPAWVASFRAKTMSKWTEWAKHLSADERAVKEGLDPGVRQVLGRKRVLLWKKIAADLCWPDAGVFDQLLKGFELVGSRNASGIFATELRPAEQTPEQLMERARLLRPALLSKWRSLSMTTACGN